MNNFTNKKQTLRQKKLAMKKWLFSATCRTLLIVFVAVFGVMYLVQTSSVSSMGYELSDLESRVQELERETQRLDVEISQHRSIQSIQDRLKDMDMVRAESVEYVDAREAVVARR